MLITKLSSAFTDTTLPILQKDPVLPNAGGVFLLDSKNSASWNGSSVIAVDAPLNTLTRAAAADGTNPGLGVFSVGENTPVSLSSVSKPLAYNSATGRITFPTTSDPTAAARFIESQAQGLYLFNGTDAFCISAWVYVAPTGVLHLLFTQPAGNNNARQGLTITASVASGFQVTRPSMVGYPISPGVTQTVATANAAYGTAATITSGIHRLGYAWYRKTDNNWYGRPILNQVLGSELATPSHVTTGIDLGQTTAGGPRNQYYVAALGNRRQVHPGTFGTDNGFYRLYIENITVSGRTPEQVWAADWARGNERFS